MKNPFVLAVLFLTSCGVSPWSNDEIRAFKSSEELRSFLKSFDSSKQGFFVGTPVLEMAEPSHKNASITNNQIEGVDEGGIVKNYKNFLVVLRQHQLSLIDVENSMIPALKDQMDVVESELLREGFFADELLINGNEIVVLAYRYSPVSSVEFYQFAIQGEKLIRRGVTRIEGNDYYSSTGYSSRFKNGNLQFYFPFSLQHSGEFRLPKRLYLDEGRLIPAGQSLFEYTDVYIGWDRPQWPILHSIVQCDWKSGEDLNCQARGIFAGGKGTHFAAQDADYLLSNRNQLYRFSANDRDIDAVMLKELNGNFLESENFYKNEETLVLTGKNDGSQTSVYLVEEHQFGRKKREAVKPIKSFEYDASRIEAVAYNGDFVMFAESSHINKANLTTFNYRDRSSSKQRLNFAVSRIEGNRFGDVFLIGEKRTWDDRHQWNEVSMNVQSMNLENPLEMTAQVQVTGAALGEMRSHSFFVHENEGETVLALSLSDLEEGLQLDCGFGSYRSTISNILYIGFANQELRPLMLSQAGEESERSPRHVDWYGNTRPIFLHDKVFSLMGSELTPVCQAEGLWSDCGEPLFF